MIPRRLNILLTLKPGDMRTLLFIFLLSSCLKIGYAQEVDYSKFQGTKVKCGLNSKLDKPYFKEYGQSYFGQYLKINQFSGAKLKDSPEEILVNVYQSKSDSELKKHFTKNAKADAKLYKRQLTISEDTAKNFLILRHKLTFSINNSTELVIIKYTQFVDSVSVQDYTIQAIGENAKWKGIRVEEYNDMELVVANVTAKEFWSLNKRAKLDKDDAPISEKVLSQVKDEEGVLNLSKLAAVIRERKKNGKKEIFVD
jgi:hypothetical protein